MRSRKFEFITSLTLFLWGFWVSCPFIEPFTVSRIFDKMKNIGNEYQWGIPVLFIGTIQMIFIFTNKKKMRLIMSFISMLSLITLTILFIMGNWQSTAVPLYGVFILCSWFAFTEILDENDIIAKKGGELWK